MLALTFSRKAAEQLRDRVTARLGRTMSTPLSSTFHSFAYGLVRRYAPAELYAAPLRLLQRARAGRRAPGAAHRQPRVGRAGPSRCAAAVGTRGFAREVHAVLARARERGLDPDDLRRARPRRGASRSSRRPGCSCEQYLDVLDDQAAIDYPDLIARAA